MKIRVKVVDCPISYNEHGEEIEDARTFYHVYEGTKLLKSFDDCNDAHDYAQSLAAGY